MAQTVVWVIFLLIAAAIFRIFFLDLIEFKGDEATTVYEIQKFYDKPYLFQVGTRQSTGFYSPPLYNFLMVLLSLYSRHPQIISLVIAVMNTISVIVFYFLIRRYYAELTARFGSVLLALSPIPILFSRKIWSPDVVLWFVLPIFYFTHEFLIKRSQKAAFGLFLSLSLLIQLHPTGIFLSAAIIITMLVLKVRINFYKSLTGFFLGLIFAIPFFYREFTSNPICIDCSLFLQNQQESTFPFDFRHLALPFQLTNGLYFPNILGADYSAFLKVNSLINLINIAGIISVILPLLSLFFILKKQKKYLFLLLIIAPLPILYFITRTRFSIHYYIVLIPFITLLYVLPIQIIKNKLLKVFFIATLLTLIFSNFIFEINFNSFLSYKKNIRGDYGKIFALTDEFVQSQVKQYRDLPDYDKILTYSYVFSQYPPFHQRMGEYFASVGLPLQAIAEFKKAASENSLNSPPGNK